MSGILDKKSRIIDFILTEEGYKQMSIQDIRFKYATFSDNSSLYESDENNVYISGSYNFRMEASNNILDLVNPEIDLNRGGFYNLGLDTGDGSSLNAYDLLSNNDNQTFLTASSVLHKRIENSLKEKNILLTTGSLDLDNIMFYTDSGTNEFERFNLIQSNGEFPPTMLKQDVYLTEFDLIKDDARFANKTNFMYMPPITKNGSALGNYINTQDGPSKIIVKNSVNNILDFSNAINESIDQLDNNDKVQKKTFHITKKKSDDKFIFQIYDIAKSLNLIEKLVIIDHGDVQYIDLSGRRKFRRVFSAGKLYRIQKNLQEYGYLQSDQQTKIKSYFGFSNIFTITFEE